MCKLGEDIRLARLRRRLTQQSLAEQVGASLNTIKRMESGDARIPLHFIARTLHVFGEITRLADLLDSGQDAIGLAPTNEQLPQRVRPRTRQRTALEKRCEAGGASLHRQSRYGGGHLAHPGRPARAQRLCLCRQLAAPCRAVRGLARPAAAGRSPGQACARKADSVFHGPWPTPLPMPWGRRVMARAPPNGASKTDAGRTHRNGLPVRRGRLQPGGCPAPDGQCRPMPANR